MNIRHALKIVKTMQIRKPAGNSVIASIWMVGLGISAWRNMTKKDNAITSIC